MSRMPPVPPEQRTFGKQKTTDGHEDRHDLSHADSDTNTREQGRFGNLTQNVKSVQWKTQDR